MAPGFFSIGGIVARLLPRVGPVVAWGAPALGLTMLAFWDVFARGGSPDTILLGLAAYELLIGLTEQPTARPS